MQVFDEIFVYDLDSLDVDYKRRHAEFVTSNPRGFGYWIWKPQVIKQVLSNSRVDDLIVYMDVGFTLSRPGAYRFLEYLEIARESRWRLLSFQNTHTEYKWTKADLAARLGVQDSSEIMKTSLLAAGFMVVGATAANKALVDDWAAVAVESSYRYSDDSPSVRPNHPEFIEHRHDASISSLLRKIRGTAVTHYEVQPYNQFDNDKGRLPAWATRSRQ